MNAWDWAKKKVADHPALTGALVGAVIVASGGMAAPIVIAAGAAGAAIGANISKDPGSK